MASRGKMEDDKSQKPPRRIIPCANCGKEYKSRTKLMRHVFSDVCRQPTEPSKSRSTKRENIQPTKQDAASSLDTFSSRTLSMATSPPQRQSSQAIEAQRYTQAQQPSYRNNQARQPQIDQLASQPQQYLRASPDIREPQTARRKVMQAPQYSQPGQTQRIHAQPTYVEPTQVQSTYARPMYDEPTYSQPVYDQPVYGQPGYGQPMYGQPTYAQPNDVQQAPSQPQWRPQPIYDRQYESSSDDSNYHYPNNHSTAQLRQAPSLSADEWSDRSPSLPSSQCTESEDGESEDQIEKVGSEEDDSERYKSRKSASDEGETEEDGSGYSSRCSDYSDGYGGGDDHVEQHDDHDHMSDGGYANDGGSSHGGYSGGGYSDGGYSDGGYSDGGYSDGGYSDGGYSDGGYSSGY